MHDASVLAIVLAYARMTVFLVLFVAGLDRHRRAAILVGGVGAVTNALVIANLLDEAAVLATFLSFAVAAYLYPRD